MQDDSDNELVINDVNMGRSASSSPGLVIQQMANTLPTSPPVPAESTEENVFDIMNSTIDVMPSDGAVGYETSNIDNAAQLNAPLNNNSIPPAVDFSISTNNEVLESSGNRQIGINLVLPAHVSNDQQLPLPEDSIPADYVVSNNAVARNMSAALSSIMPAGNFSNSHVPIVNNGSSMRRQDFDDEAHRKELKRLKRNQSSKKSKDRSKARISAIEEACRQLLEENGSLKQSVEAAERRAVIAERQTVILRKMIAHAADNALPNIPNATSTN